MHKIRWDDLQFVFAVAEAGSLAGAARALGVNHTTVLRRVSAFEAQNGVTLFERDARGYRLTPESHHLLSAMRSIGKTVESLERSMVGQGASIDGPVRLTSTDSMFHSVLMPHVRSFRERFPGVALELMVTNTRLNYAQLEADVTVRPAKTLPSDLAGERICPLTFRVYGAPGYLARNPSKDPKLHDWLGVHRCLVGTPIGEWQQGALSPETIVLRSDSFVALADAAAMGLGLAMLPSYLGDITEALTRAEAFPDTVTTNLWIAAHPDLIETPRVRVCVEHFGEALRSEAAFLSGARPRPTR